MTTTYSTSLKLALIGNGDQSNVWGTTTNTNLGTLLEQAITGVQTITMANANYTLSNLNGAADEARNAVLVVQGTNSAVRQIIAPLVEKLYTISNQTTGGYAVTIGGSSGLTVSIPNGTTGQVYCDGSNFYSSTTTSAGNYNVSGDLVVAGTITAQGASNIVPAGSLMMWPTASAPSGYLICNGAAVSRSTYAALFGIVGTTFGAGDGSTTFNLPNYNDRMPIGAGATYSANSQGGSKDAIVVSHSHTAGSSSSVSDPGHSHGVSDPGHAHSTAFFITPSSGSNPGFSNGGLYPPTTANTGTAAATTGIGIFANTTNISVSTSTTVNSTGGSATNANLPPYLGIYFIIKH